jgi:hypothetical protein
MEFIVAPLTEHEAILGMPFLMEEGILINPAQSKVILPTVHTEEGLSEEDLHDDFDDDLEQGLEREPVEELTIEVEGMDGDHHNGVGIVHEGGGGSMDTMELVKAEFPSICLKIKRVGRLVPL